MTNRPLTDRMSAALTEAVEHDGWLQTSNTMLRRGLVSRGLVDDATGEITDAGRAATGAAPQLSRDSREEHRSGVWRRLEDGPLDEVLERDALNADRLAADAPSDPPTRPYDATESLRRVETPGKSVEAVLRAIQSGGYGGTARGIERDLRPARTDAHPTRWIAGLRQALYSAGCDRAGDALRIIPGKD